MKARAVLGGLAVGLSTLFGACFEADEELEGLACEIDSHCGRNLVCIPNPGGLDEDFDGVVDPAKCGEAPATTSPTTTASTTAGGCVQNEVSCAAGETCCSGTCSDDGTGALRCLQQCTVQTDCITGCCAFNPDLGVSVCGAC